MNLLKRFPSSSTASENVFIRTLKMAIASRSVIHSPRMSRMISTPGFSRCRMLSLPVRYGRSLAHRAATSSRPCLVSTAFASAASTSSSDARGLSVRSV